MDILEILPEGKTEQNGCETKFGRNERGTRNTCPRSLILTKVGQDIAEKKQKMQKEIS